MTSLLNSLTAIWERTINVALTKHMMRVRGSHFHRSLTRALPRCKVALGQGQS